MRISPRPLAPVGAVMIAAALLGPLAGCATGGKNKGDTSYVARDVDTLYNGAKDRLDRRPV